MSVKLFSIAFVALVSFGETSLSHDALGLLSQQKQILKLSDADRALLLRRENFRDADYVFRVLEEAMSAAKSVPAQKNAPSDANKLPSEVPRTAIESVLLSVGDSRAFWGNGQLLTVCFLDGDPASQAQFMAVAAEEIKLTDLKLDASTPACGSSGAMIHVSFNDSGYYSYVGKDALLFGENVATLNLSGMGSSGTWSSSWVGIARHEIGHMLGLLHEHQHPDVNCNFKSDDEIAKLLGWTIAQVQTNFAQIKRTPTLVVTHYDQKSIMHYQLDARFFKDGEKSDCFISAANSVLSSGDVQYLKLIYP
ncbi:MAG: M12 family metallopeptidase [Pseudomonadota bacterium]|nr:M12 family metallopeptidase [Pseudomonadota bacterium]